MTISQDDSGQAERASQAAYSEAVKVAYNTLAGAITDYLDDHRAFSKNDICDVPENFRPLRDYERALKIQELVLRLALKAAASAAPSDGVGLPGYANGYCSSPAVQTLLDNAVTA